MSSYPALNWSDLGTPIQADLGSKGLDKAWFDSIGKVDALRKTVLNLYVKMAGMSIASKKIWDFVDKQFDVTQGRLEFLVTPNVNVFMHALEISSTFTNPGSNPLADWDSREFVPNCQLHFKHFSGWPEKDRVEAHIDPNGLYSGPGIGRINVFQMITHGCTKDHYKNVDEIQEKLIQSNWGNTILKK